MRQIGLKLGSDDGHAVGGKKKWFKKMIVVIVSKCSKQ